jgi:hypothetical protein
MMFPRWGTLLTSEQRGELDGGQHNALRRGVKCQRGRTGQSRRDQVVLLSLGKTTTANRQSELGSVISLLLCVRESLDLEDVPASPKEEEEGQAKKVQLWTALFLDHLERLQDSHGALGRVVDLHEETVLLAQLDGHSVLRDW